MNATQAHREAFRKTAAHLRNLRKAETTLKKLKYLKTRALIAQNHAKAAEISRSIEATRNLINKLERHIRGD